MQLWRPGRRLDPTRVGAQLRGLATTGGLSDLPVTEVARLLRRQLETQSLPWWCDTVVDRRFGGFRFDGADALTIRRRRRVGSPGKQVVNQSRMIWSLARAHRWGLRPAGHDLLARAFDGYRFMRRHLDDAVHGGYVWRVDRSGAVVDDRKELYGEAFAIFGLVELARASGSRAPLEDALDLRKIVDDRLHDDRYGGWIEHALADWTWPGSDQRAPVDRTGHKSANAHLHWMEALTELYEATRDPCVAASLEEAVDVLLTHFYPADPGGAHRFLSPGWHPAADAHEEPLSLGHNVEFAWLLLEAEDALGQPPSIDRFRTYLDHALETGFDHEHGGLDMQLPSPGSPGTRSWWVQAEPLSALVVAVSRGVEARRYGAALRRQLEFILRHQVDDRDGVWWEEVEADGRVTKPVKHHEWKAGYHEIRATTVLIDLGNSEPGLDASPYDA